MTTGMLSERFRPEPNVPKLPRRRPPRPRPIDRSQRASPACGCRRGCRQVAAVDGADRGVDSMAMPRMVANANRGGSGLALAYSVRMKRPLVTRRGYAEIAGLCGAGRTFLAVRGVVPLGSRECASHCRGLATLMCPLTVWEGNDRLTRHDLFVTSEALGLVSGTCRRVVGWLGTGLMTPLSY